MHNFITKGTSFNIFAATRFHGAQPAARKHELSFFLHELQKIPAFPLPETNCGAPAVSPPRRPCPEFPGKTAARVRSRTRPERCTFTIRPEDRMNFRSRVIHLPVRNGRVPSRRTRKRFSPASALYKGPDTADVKKRLPPRGSSHTMFFPPFSGQHSSTSYIRTHSVSRVHVLPNTYFKTMPCISGDRNGRKRKSPEQVP